MYLIVPGKPVPKSVLPAADQSIVVADGAVPVNAVQVIASRIRHDGTGAAAASWTAATANARFIIEVGRGIDNDVGEILRKEPRAGRHIGERARWRGSDADRRFRY
jgi:hypothetical protein